MALARRSGQRFEANIWPGFVDAMTALLLVLVFVLSIFMMVQFMLNETITTQDSELDQLSGQVQSLAEALGLEQQRGFDLESQLDAARDTAAEQTALIASLSTQRDEQSTRIASFEQQVAGLLSQQANLEGRIATLTGERDAAQTALDEAEQGNQALVARIADIEAGLALEITEKEAAQLALAQARAEIDEGTEAARLAAARTQALQALIADLELKAEEQGRALDEAEATRLADAAAAAALQERLQNADAELTAMSLALEEKRKEAEDTLTLLAAANSAKDDLDEKLLAALLAGQTAKTASANIETSLNSQVASLEAEVARLTETGAAADEALAALESQLAELKQSSEAADVTRADLMGRIGAGAAREAKLRDELAKLKAAESTTQEELRRQLLAALAAQRAAEADAGDALSEAEQRAILLATANEALSAEQAASADSQRKVEALNQQVAALRSQLGSLQALLDEVGARDADANVQISALGTQLNTALAQVAAEQKKRAALEEAERARLEAEAKELESYRSEFFGRLRQLLGNQDGVRIEGDRFVFSSEVLFTPGNANLSPEGQGEIAKVAEILLGVADDIPAELNWVIRVDGHTDNVPLSGLGEFADNWELSQARALSVVRYMSGSLGIPPSRLAANGFGEYQPLNTADTPEARAQNRRIELKLTEK
ncbi:peptidoglycan -binding protein [uncultured Litoreibacter sp.]|uniref:peptidoglycan -binding protein n=1 Tax=uncultured Litoreibacter sp. TaxID=1392394 RepID=UPI00262CE659|nr:peptidoglycan -binding protein [uncultured Litoreibacter sp.]